MPLFQKSDFSEYASCTKNMSTLGLREKISNEFRVFNVFNFLAINTQPAV